MTVFLYRPPLTADGMRPDLADAAAVFASLRAPRVVLLSSTLVYDPSHHHPGYVPEEFRVRAENPVARAWSELERLAEARLAGSELLVLRAAPVVTRDGDDLFSRLLRRRTAFVPAGYDPALQLLAADDLARAVDCAVERGAGRPGVYHVAPAGAVSVRGALRLAGVKRLAGPRWADARLEYLRHSWTVSGRKIERELGFAPTKTSAEAVLEAFGGRPAAPPRTGSAWPEQAAGSAAGAHTKERRRSKPSQCRPPDFDDYGLDERYIAAYSRTLFRFLHDVYWRIEHRGLEHVPRQGRAVLTGVHRGFMPWDGVMALHLLRRETGRIPRFLIHPCLIKFPFLANYMTKLGGIPACQESADRVLEREGLLGMFPEGIHGAFTMYRDAYKLGRFGRDEYVKMALRNRAPIVPFVTVGSAEIYPILARVESKLVRRVAEWPFLPITPTFPLPGLPLPSKWHTRFLEPLPVQRRYPPEAAADPAAVREIGNEVRGRMEEAIREMLRRRRSIFFGSVFGDETGVPREAGA